MAAGGRHSILLTAANTVYTFGFNGFGQLGLGDTTNRVKYKLADHFLSPVWCSEARPQSIGWTSGMDLARRL